MTLIPKVDGTTAGKGTGKLVNKMTSKDHSNCTIAMIRRNTEKSPGDLLLLKLQWKVINLHFCEKLSKCKMIIIIGVFIFLANNLEFISCLHLTIIHTYNIYIYIYIYIYICMYTYLCFIYVCVCICVCMRAWVCGGKVTTSWLSWEVVIHNMLIITSKGLRIS